MAFLQKSRQRVVSGTPWEAVAGYSRAIRVGNTVFVSGTTAMKDGKIVGIGDAAAQTSQILETITSALSQVGASVTDVVRYRVYVTDIGTWQAVSAELTKVFGQVRPAATLVEVSALIEPDLLVEIEVDALVGSAAHL